MSQEIGNEVCFKVLSRKQIKEIHSASLKILEKTGVKVFDQEAIALLKKAGLNITEGNLVRIPPLLVEEALSGVPSKITIYNQDKKPSLFLEEGKVYFGTGSDCPNIIDLFTGKRRPAVKEDIAKLSLFCDYLPNIDFVMSMCSASDVPPTVSDRHHFEAMVLNTKKPIIFTANDKCGFEDILDITAVIAGSPEELQKHPFLILYEEPTSPLQHSKPSLQKLLLAAEKNIPVIYNPAIMAGATGPVTLAGLLATGNAEILSGLVMHQLKQKGAPFIYGVGFDVMDMSTTIDAYAAPESLLTDAAACDLARYYNLPIFSLGGVSDAKVLDQQAGAEIALSCLMGGLSGANLIHDAGYLESGMTSSYESILLNDEIIGEVKQILKGIEVNTETLAVDVIDKVGPGGNFLVEEATLKNFKKIWYPKYLDRQRYHAWVDSGKKTLFDKLNIGAKKILKEYTPEPVSSKIKERIEEIIRKRENDF